jgi:hypothetical protein
MNVIDELLFLNSRLLIKITLFVSLSLSIQLLILKWLQKPYILIAFEIELCFKETKNVVIQNGSIGSTKHKVTMCIIGHIHNLYNSLQQIKLA